MKSKKIYLLAPLLLSVAVLICGQAFMHPATNKNIKNNAAGFAVIELFTSEGCSSCPSADAVVAKFLTEHPDNVYVLAFHVDYWNRLGWKDTFSDAAYSARQNQYADAFGLQGAYTPQIVVNGKKEFVGSNGMQLKRVVDDELSATNAKELIVSATATERNLVVVNYQATKKMANKLNVVLIQLHAASDVKRGENEGRHLEHINVVRNFKAIPLSTLTGSVKIEIPKDLSKDDCRIIAYLQDAASMQVFAAAESIIQ